jgi:hypothetical protein
VAEGTRTPDHRDHNPGLYQLSYRHRARDRIARPAPRDLGALRGAGGGKVAPDQRLDELLLGSYQLDAVTLELVGAGADRAERLALVDEPADLLAERLDGWELDDGSVHDEG